MPGKAVRPGFPRRHNALVQRWSAHRGSKCCGPSCAKLRPELAREPPPPPKIYEPVSRGGGVAQTPYSRELRGAMVRRARFLALCRGLGHADVWDRVGGRPAYCGNDDAAAREIDPRSGA